MAASQEKAALHSAQAVATEQPPVAETPPSLDHLLGAKGPLAVHFLFGYLEGDLLKDGTSGYTRKVDDCGMGVLEHGPSGIKVWQDVIDVRPAGLDDRPVLLFHYTSPTIFAGSMAAKTTMQMMATLSREHVGLGRGVFATKFEPSEFGCKQRVLLNYFGTPETDPWMDLAEAEALVEQVEDEWEGHADYCIPILVSEEALKLPMTEEPVPVYFQHKVRRRKSKGGDEEHRSSRRPCSPTSPSLGRDMWQVHVQIDQGAVVMKNDPAEVRQEHFKRRLKKLRQAFGEGHPETLAAFLGLAKALEDRGQHDGAELLCRKALGGLCVALGVHHPATLAAFSHLGRLLSPKRKVAEAEALLRMALEGQKLALGHKHPSTLLTLSELSTLLRNDGRAEEAEPMGREALEGLSSALGRSNPVTLAVKGALASLLQERAQLEEADRLSMEMLEGRKEQLGKLHPDTLASLGARGELLQARGRLTEAEELYRSALSGLRGSVQADNRLTALDICCRLALLLRQQNQPEEAERLLRECLEGRRALLGSKHPLTLASVGQLAIYVEETGSWREAKTLLMEELIGLAELHGRVHADVARCARRFARILRKHGEENEARGVDREYRIPKADKSRPDIAG